MITVSFQLFLLNILPIWAVYRTTTFLIKKKFNFKREIVISISFVYILTVVYLTFFSFEIRLYDWHPTINIVPIKKTISLLKHGSLRTSFKNVAGNILLLSPIGVFLPMLFTRARNIGKVLTAGFLTSVFIEVVQLMTAVRICDIDDVILNTTGALLGYLAYITLRKAFKKLSLLESLVEDTNSRSLLVQAIKLIVIICLFTIPLCLISFYQNTYSISYSYSLDKSIYLNPTDMNTEMVVENLFDYDDYKIVLATSNSQDDSEKINVFVYRKVPFNRVVYIGQDSLEVKDTKNAYDTFNVMPDKDTMLNIVYGKNSENLAAVVEIERGVETSCQILSDNPYFVFASASKTVNKRLDVRLLDGEGNNITSEFYTSQDMGRGKKEISVSCEAGGYYM